MTGPSEDDARRAFGHFATGVVIVTAATPDGPAGFTCQAFGSLSVDPPSVLFAARRSSASWARMRAVGVLGVSILAQDHEPVARLFATTGADKFAGREWDHAPGGSPLLPGALAHLEGRVRLVENHGDHDVVVVDLAHVETFAGAPLVYFRSEYRHLA
ncbi:MAG TPA: flavin reductase family protein [Acidimicrobiales bacterium]|nr:flavin reductase family protein [Acidimicrobiales bacterium]